MPFVVGFWLSGMPLMVYQPFLEWLTILGFNIHFRLNGSLSEKLSLGIIIFLVILITPVLDKLFGRVSPVVLMTGNEVLVARSNNHRLYLFPFARKPHALIEGSAKGILGTHFFTLYCLCGEETSRRNFSLFGHRYVLFL